MERDGRTAAGRKKLPSNDGRPYTQGAAGSVGDPLSRPWHDDCSELSYPLLPDGAEPAPGRGSLDRKEPVMSKVQNIADVRARHGLALVHGVADALNAASSFEHGLERFAALLARDPAWSGCQLLERRTDGSVVAAAQWRRNAGTDRRSMRVADPVPAGPRAVHLARRAFEGANLVWDEPESRRRDAPPSSTAAALPIRPDLGPATVLVLRWRPGGPRREALDGAMLLAGQLLARLADRERRPQETDRARSEVRREIARELHDDLGQQLAGLAMLARALIGRTARTEDALDDALGELVDGLSEAHDTARGLAHDLAQRQVEPDGLERALRAMTRRSGAGLGVECTLEVDQGTRVRDAAAATHLVRIAQEAVHNALAHGQPQRVAVGLGRIDGGLRLEVRDDGRGLPAGAARSGLGLTSMRERAREIGASLAVTSQAGLGTTVCCALPGGAS